MNDTYLILPEPWRKRLTFARGLLAALFLGAAGYFFFQLFFPDALFIFEFRNPKAASNTLLDPHDTEWQAISNGRVSPETSLTFDASVIGDYSRLTPNFLFEKESKRPLSGSVTVRKSYRAFFYPEGPPLTVNNSENAQLFRVNDTYYQLLPDSLHPFVSEKAYTSRYALLQALPQDENFLTSYPVSEDWIGFPSGMLLAFADGVFIVDGQLVRPIGDAVIFEALGFHWGDVIPVSEEEMGIYKRGKIFLLGSIHPDGTVFFDEDTGAYFLIQEQTKRRLMGENTIQTYTRNLHPISVSSQALELTESCQLEDKGWWKKRKVCSLPLDVFAAFPGNSYQIETHFSEPTDIQTAAALFESAIDIKNLRTSLSKIKQRILLHYGY